MNFKANTLISVTALILGCLLLGYLERPLSNIILFICGLAFVIPGIMSLITLAFRKTAENHSAVDRALRLICGIAALGLGIVVWCLPDVFRPLLVYLFGILLVAGGIFQSSQLSRKTRAAQYPGWLIVCPLLLIVAGVVLIVVDYFHQSGVDGAFENEKWVLIVTGVGAIIYGITGLIIISYAMRQRRHDNKAAKLAKKNAAVADSATTVASRETAAGDRDSKADNKPAAADQPADNTDKPAGN